ncbi:protein phosphatase 2C domain-containing protein [Kitasatospora sp. NBC_01287]|uniref:protein phosphatase 2C domain-containing protein n=1 Tax=Kitasatospora sp. NBC_01287 TaxID=2903573 RepID=UPI0022516293|nr:protein phosphatase 2C domain-containing protein [Kitasatospora sp. NBC_01287]MCX4747518.1 protein phosphatase 2C domain-containing protein [Kitasatospora sp. NBC_01287]
MQVHLAGQPAQPGRENEDFAAATPEALVLLDGSGSPEGMESGCRHGTAWYARRLGVHLLARLTDRSDRSITECLADAIVETAALHGARCDLAHPGTPAAMVVAARLHGPSLEYLVLGDSLLVLEPKSGPPVVIGDNQPFEAGEALLRSVVEAEHGGAERAALRLRHALAVRAVRNTGRGPWIAAASPKAAAHAETGFVRLDSLRALAAVTDGAARYTGTFALGDWVAALRLLAESGPGALVGAVREVEAADPRCELWPRGQAQDDATALHALI